MASTDPGVITMRVPIELPTLGVEAFERDLAKCHAGATSAQDYSEENHRAVLASVFHEVWNERVGLHAAGNQETRDNLTLWGNALLDRIPLKHVIIVETGQGLKCLIPPVATRTVFLRWVEQKLPGLIDQLRHEHGRPVALPAPPALH